MQTGSSLLRGILSLFCAKISWKDANDAFNKKKGLPATQPPTGRGRGRGGPNRGAAASIIQGRSNLRTIDRQDKNIWIHLVHHLRREKLLPVVIFVFSKRRCEENAAVLTNIDLCTANEKSEVHVVIEKSIARLKAEDHGLPQIRRIRDLLSRGIAVHHGGLLPIVKEVRCTYVHN
jgi:antiviral helicase SKI2